MKSVFKFEFSSFIRNNKISINCKNIFLSGKLSSDNLIILSMISPCKNSFLFLFKHLLIIFKQYNI